MQNFSPKNRDEDFFSPPRSKSYFDTAYWARWLIGSCFILLLFIFLHFREVRIDFLDLDRPAEKYIVAQTSFSFFDPEATTIAKEESTRDIGKIFKISEKILRDIRQQPDKIWTSLETSRHEVPEANIKNFYHITDLLIQFLKKVRFTDPRTVQIAHNAGFNTEFFYIFSPYSIEEPLKIPAHLWSSWKEVLFAEEPSTVALEDLVLTYFENLRWNIEEDVPFEKKLYSKVQKGISPQYGQIHAGDRIIDQGEEVTLRHLSIMQAMKHTLQEQRNLFSTTTITGSLLLSLIFLVVFSLYTYYNHPRIFRSNKKLLLLTTIIFLTLVISRSVETWLLNAKNLQEWIRYPIFVPLAAILSAYLINPQIAAFVSAFLTVVLLLTETINSVGVVINLGVSLLCIFAIRSLRQRKEIFIICVKGWLAATAIILAIHFYNQTGLESLSIDLSASAVFLLLTAILAIGLLPLLEALFHIVTDTTLMELMDPTHPLLRRLSIEAPGTYQHSIVVANLSETAANNIGANGLFCRATTMYHDIGKVVTPQYFTENQQPGINVHRLLTPQESAQVIIAHVYDGIVLAEEASLPRSFVDIIKEHHGTSLVYYFYQEELKKNGGDASKVDESDFRYAGPKPRSKESAIIMIADSFEAAARSLDEISENTLTALIETIVQIKMDDGQLDECSLTIKELNIVKQTFVETLLAAGHLRVKYPKYESKNKEPYADIA